MELQFDGSAFYSLLVILNSSRSMSKRRLKHKFIQVCHLLNHTKIIMRFQIDNKYNFSLFVQKTRVEDWVSCYYSFTPVVQELPKAEN